MNKLGDLLSAVFPGLKLSRVTLQQDMYYSKLIIEIEGSWELLADPEAMMDPRVLKILKAEKSAEEMRDDEG